MAQTHVPVGRVFLSAARSIGVCVTRTKRNRQSRKILEKLNRISRKRPDESRLFS